ncbi:hypothetical protein [Rathayibacter festucae]|uniref:Uncharacterized protein n=1 Tax=Rathayibacter festucae DSM 15932 TaxID=1328866 RepID=A0A3T0SZU9_9MICO|nr:hypothetical protein [Rathayibacter festucae]AZZ51874.1 hypothetical protein C1I64_07305 [Rathayibacter festucae DSM 15932]
MISDSVPWREHLCRSATALEKRSRSTRWNQRTSFLVERDLINGMFAIRRLMESAKTSSNLPQERVSCGVHPLSGRIPRIYDRWSFWEHYDMTSRQQTQLTVKEFVSLFIHSFILDFHPTSADGPSMIWVVSDRDRHKRLYSVTFERVIALFRRVGNEDLVFYAGPFDGNAVRLSQHDIVDAGFSTYDPFPDVANWTAPPTALQVAFPALDWPPPRTDER